MQRSPLPGRWAVAGPSARRPGLPLNPSMVAWFAPAIIALGTVLTVGIERVDDVREYIGLSMVAVAAAAVLARSATVSGGRATVRWILLGVFVGAYFVQYWWMLLDPLGATWLWPVWRDADLQQTYRWTVAGFAAAAITVAVLDRVSERPPSVADGKGETARALARFATYAAVALIGINTPLMVGFGVGVVGSPVDLPFRLAGIIQNVQRGLIPMLLLTGLYGSLVGGLKRRFWLLSLVYFGAALLDTVVTTSKQPLIQWLVGTVMLVALANRFSPRVLRNLALGVVALVLIYPAFAYQRDMRNAGAGVRGAVGGAVAMSLRERTAVDGLRALVFRGGGADVLASIIAENARLPDDEWPIALGGGTDVSVFLTQVIFGFRASESMGVAPSLLGWLYIALGPGWIPLGVALFVVVAEIVWRRLSRARLVARIPILASTATYLLIVCNEGTLDGQGIPLLVLVVSAAFTEQVARFASRQTSTRALTAGAHP